jgi:dipeptide/tripeptide permease
METYPASWQVLIYHFFFQTLIFAVEGAPAIIVAPFVYFFLADSAQKAKFLTEDEKEAATARLGTRDTTEKTKLNWKQVTAGLSDYQPYVHALIHFCCNYSFAGLANFLPTIVQALGYSSIKAQGLTAPPYAAAFILCIAAAFFSDKFGHRGFVIAGCSAMAGVGYLLLAIVEDTNKMNIRYLGIWFAVMGVFPSLTLNITWLLNNQGGETKRGIGIAVIAILGQCSSFLSSAMYPKKDA